MKIDKDPILELLRKKKRALHVSELVGKLGLPRKAKDPLVQVLSELASLGLVAELPGSRYRATREQTPRRARSKRDAVVGRLTMHVSGFGFVAREDGGEDVFIPPTGVGSALHGDRVEILARPSPKGWEGEIVAVADRGFSRLGGIYQRSGGNAWIDPDDPRMRGPMSVRGKLPGSVEPGAQVIAEIIGYPEHSDDLPTVRVAEVLGKQGLTRVEVAKLLLRDAVVDEFDPDTLSEAASLPDHVTRTDRRGREDLRSFDLCTIDPVDARDHDDAVWAERTKEGGFRVLIAIADVSHYVRPGTALDRSALERGCSVYLPDRAIPMLPPELSSNLASLLPKKDRLCLAVEAEIGSAGAVKSHRFIEGIMRSHASLTYEGVANALGLSKEAPAQKEAVARRESLQVLLDLSQILRARRTRRGSLDFDLPEGRIRFDDGGEPVDVYRMKGDPGVRQAYRLVEEMMLLANEVVARDLDERGIPSIYRVHATPDEKKLGRFCRLAEALGYRIDLEQATNPRLLSKFLRKTEGKPYAEPLRMLLLRAMKQAVYDVSNIGHFGLGAKHYLHFTSPIRRYPDLEVHRVLRRVLQKEKFDGKKLRDALKLSAVESSRLERRAMTLERDVMDLYRAILMKDRVGDEFEATITGVASHGVYATLDAPFVDVLLPAEALGRDLELDELGIRLSTRHGGAKWTLGDRVRVRLEESVPARREIVALPVDDVHSVGPLNEIESEPARSGQRKPRKAETQARTSTKSGRRSRRNPQHVEKSDGDRRSRRKQAERKRSKNERSGESSRGSKRRKR